MTQREVLTKFYKENPRAKPRQAAEGTGIGLHNVYTLMKEIRVENPKLLPPAKGTNITKIREGEATTRKILLLLRDCPAITQKEIQQRLNLSRNTVTFHINRIRRDWR